MEEECVSECSKSRPVNSLPKVHLLILCSLAMAEMTTLVTAIYRNYTTATKGGFDLVSPGITARYEVFYEESCSGMRVSLSLFTFLNIALTLFQEHECQVEFSRHVGALLSTQH